RAAYAARTAAARRVKPKHHRVKGHLAKTPGKRTKHRVAGHLAKNPKHHGARKRKSRKGMKGRSPAQIAAFHKMIAARDAKLRGRRAPTAAERAHGHAAFAKAVRKGRKHLVKGHLAKNAHGRGKPRVAAHMAHDPTDIRGHHRPRLG